MSPTCEINRHKYGDDNRCIWCRMPDESQSDITRSLVAFLNGDVTTWICEAGERKDFRKRDSIILRLQMFEQFRKALREIASDMPGTTAERAAKRRRIARAALARRVVEEEVE